MLDLRPSVRLAAWGGACLGGRASPDEAAVRVWAGDEPHQVTGLPTEPGPTSLPVALGRLRAGGASALLLVLPAPGDPLGLPGPLEFNQAALDAAEAVLTVGGPPLALVPLVGRHGPPGDQTVTVTWQVWPVRPYRPGDLPSLPEAEQELAQAVRTVADELHRLDVARWEPEAAAAVAVLRRPSGLDDPLPAGYPPAARRVLALSRRVAAIAALAARTEGAAVTGTEMAARASALQPLERASRRAQVAAVNALV